MSANNQLVVYQPEPLVWAVKEIDVDTGGKNCDVGDEYPDLENAIRAANEYMEENEVEYGLRINLAPPLTNLDT